MPTPGGRPLPAPVGPRRFVKNEPEEDSSLLAYAHGNDSLRDRQHVLTCLQRLREWASKRPYLATSRRGYSTAQYIRRDDAG